jgi:hypothetical protein
MRLDARCASVRLQILIACCHVLANAQVGAGDGASAQDAARPPLQGRPERSPGQLARGAAPVQGQWRNGYCIAV